MDTLTLKIILLVFMGLVPLVFGFMPLQLYKVMTKAKGRLGRNAATTVSMLSCFSGGVILGVCLIELLPEARENWTDALARLHWHTDYPFVEMLAGVGFLVVYFVEGLMSHMCGLKHDHHDEGASEVFSQMQSECGSSASGEKLECDGAERARRRAALAAALSFVLALLFHASLEGFAFGVQERALSLSSLFFGIVTHKALVGFSVGMNLARSLRHNRPLAMFLVALIASFSPVGGAIGILVQNSPMDETVRAFATSVLTCFSIGTFVYIAFFEILAPEHGNGQPPLLQWASCTLGYIVMAGFLAFNGEEHDH